MRADELERNWIFSARRSVASYEEKIKGINKSVKLLKGKDHAQARQSLVVTKHSYKTEINNLNDLINKLSYH